MFLARVGGQDTTPLVTPGCRQGWLKRGWAQGLTIQSWKRQQFQGSKRKEGAVFPSSPCSKQIQPATNVFEPKILSNSKRILSIPKIIYESTILKSSLKYNIFKYWKQGKLSINWKYTELFFSLPLFEKNQNCSILFDSNVIISLLFRPRKVFPTGYSSITDQNRLETASITCANRNCISYYQCASVQRLATSVR